MSEGLPQAACGACSPINPIVQSLPAARHLRMQADTSRYAACSCHDVPLTSCCMADGFLGRPADVPNGSVLVGACSGRNCGSIGWLACACTYRIG